MSDVQAKTYAGGATLPALTAEYQPVQVGRNEDNELVPEQRAFVATVRNRSDGDMYIKEGNGDGIRISPGESYVVMRTNGTSQLMLKGTNVGTDYEVRTVEAHNDFDLTDKIEGFVQSVSALLRSSRVQKDRMVSENSLGAGTKSAYKTVSGANITLGTGNVKTITWSASFTPQLLIESLSGESYFEWEITNNSSASFSAEFEFIVDVDGSNVIDLGTIQTLGTAVSDRSGNTTDTYQPTGVAYIADGASDVRGTWVAAITNEDSTDTLDFDYSFTGEHSTNVREIENN